MRLPESSIALPSLGSDTPSASRRQTIGAMAQSARLISELRKNLLALNSGTDAVSRSLRRLRPTSACCLVPNWIACTCGTQDRKSVVVGKSVSVRVDLGGRRIIKKKQH